MVLPPVYSLWLVFDNDTCGMSLDFTTFQDLAIRWLIWRHDNSIAPPTNSHSNSTNLLHRHNPGNGETRKRTCFPT